MVKTITIRGEEYLVHKLSNGRVRVIRKRDLHYSGTYKSLAAFRKEDAFVYKTLKKVGRVK